MKGRTAHRPGESGKRLPCSRSACQCQLNGFHQFSAPADCGLTQSMPDRDGPWVRRTEEGCQNVEGDFFDFERCRLTRPQSTPKALILPEHAGVDPGVRSFEGRFKTVGTPPAASRPDLNNGFRGKSEHRAVVADAFGVADAVALIPIEKDGLVGLPENRTPAGVLHE